MERPVAKKKKRRLRKPIRITLWVLGISLCASLVGVGVDAFTKDDPTSLGTRIAKSLETGDIKHLTQSPEASQQLIATNGDDSQTIDELSEESLDESSLISQEEKPETATSQESSHESEQSENSSSQSSSKADSEESISHEAAAVNQEPIATILVDPGHGGSDPGMVANDPANPEQEIHEKNVDLDAAYEFKDAMAQINPRIKVELTREGDPSTIDESTQPYDEVADLTNRVNLVDAKHADYFLSLHCNSSEDTNMSGYELYIKPNDQATLDITSGIEHQFSTVGWTHQSAIISTDYYPLQVVSTSKVPAILVEMGYLTNPNDLNELMNKERRMEMMKALAQAYSDYITSHPKAEGQSSEASSTSDSHS